MITIAALCALPILLVTCKKDDEEVPTEESEQLVGNPGNPRFNLQFTNPSNVDLDLYVKTPDGTVINYGNPTGQGGQLDVDCLCQSCTQGPNENIYSQDGTAPSGTYEYWVEYYGDCGTAGAASEYTVRVLKNSSVIQKKTGTLNAEGESPHWTHVQ